MKRFIFSVLMFAGVLLLVLVCFDLVTTVGLKRNTTVLFGNLTKINHGEINADIIVHGCSKALVHVDPYVVDSILGVNSYNLGLDGTPFIPQNAQYELYRKTNVKPKCIIQVVSNGTLRDMSAGFKDHIKFAPYLDVPEVRKNMKLTGSFNFWDYHIPMWRYAGKPFEIITGVLSCFNVQLFPTTYRKGYFPNDKSWSEEDPENRKKPVSKEEIAQVDEDLIKDFTSLDRTSSEVFERFLNGCEKEGIKVFLVYPPIYSESFHTIEHVAYFRMVAQKYNAVFLDYSRDSLFVYDKKLFYNSQHLNVGGATIFSRKLAEEIKSRNQQAFLDEGVANSGF